MGLFRPLFFISIFLTVNKCSMQKLLMGGFEHEFFMSEVTTHPTVPNLQQTNAANALNILSLVPCPLGLYH